MILTKNAHWAKGERTFCFLNVIGVSEKIIEPSHTFDALGPL